MDLILTDEFDGTDPVEHLENRILDPGQANVDALLVATTPKR